MEPVVDHTPPEEPAESHSGEVRVEDVPGNESSDAEEEEDECRVCRGPAEEGHPLFAPCKCSGSIGLTHQDCLVSWLDVTRGDGRCELCKTKFRFDPRYAENTPDRLPRHEVFLGLSSRFLAKWLPLALRIMTAATLWLVLAPLLTACLYHGWMHRPSSILTRWSRELIPGDIVSGAIIVGIIIISFLSLMSFADFLRVHWQQPEHENDDAQGRRNGHGNDFEDGHVVDNNDEEEGIDDAIVDFIEDHSIVLASASRPYELAGESSEEALQDTSQADGATSQHAQTIETARQQLESTIRGTLQQAAAGNVDQDDAQDSDEEAIPHDDGDSESDGEYDPDDDSGEEDDDEFDNEFEDEDAMDDDDEDPPPEAFGNGNGVFDPLDPVLQDDQVDMEINVALDELLGLRGPPSTLIRNLLWLLAFNATYLGFFSFVPKTVGSAIYAGLLNTTACGKALKTIPYMYSDNQNQTTVYSSIVSLNQASTELNTTFNLPDVATVTLGYFSLAGMLVLLRYGWLFSQKLRQRFSVEAIHENERGGPLPNDIWREQNRRLGGRRDAMDQFAAREGIDLGASTAVGVALDACVAVVKVGILLFLKMFMLPIILGLSLDASTMSLFGHSLSDRLNFAGTDLFSFVLLHWVGGITFMLLVTVFLLQLREVTHPDLLARLIRPQEPQPDLLGNLMNESVLTHIKRMVLSLAIYAPIMMVYVTLPVQLLLRSGLTNYLSFFKIHFWHLAMPHMQIPLELIVFHLSMLALLERYKNTIGIFQHNWMKVMCRKMGLTEYVLPLSVEKFEMIGTKTIFRLCGDESREVDPFWYELAKRKVDIESFVEPEIQREDAYVETKGETKNSGERVYSVSVNYIRLPSEASKDDSKNDTLLPTKIGRYRLHHRKDDENENMVIEFWSEVSGEEIPRPPEGWDDLGAGGAFVQGRWAWAKEKPSIVEGGVAKRTEFQDLDTRKRPTGLMINLAILVALSWFAVTSVVFMFISAPLAVGRSLYFLFRVDPSYIHDPLAFVVGACLVFPGISQVLKIVRLEEGNLGGRFRQWILAFKPPPRQKLLVFGVSIFLWSFIAPLALGLSYELAIVKTSKWFHGGEVLLDVRSLVLSWMVGFAVLNAWAFFAYFSVFTRQFWANVGNGMLEPPLDENGNPVPARNDRRGNNRGAHGDVAADRMDWQGKEGRVSRFFDVWIAVFLEWNWEKVDRVTLLDEFAYPVARQLTSALVGSTLAFQFLLALVPFVARSEHGKILLPLLGGIERGIFRQSSFRSCMAIHVLVQLCSAFRDRLDIWFEAAHAAARDDRYLIGEVLMNYEAENQ